MSTSLQAAIDACKGELQLEPGQYDIAAPGVTIPSNTTIKGVRGRTVLRAIGPGWNGSIVTVGGNDGPLTPVTGTDGISEPTEVGTYYLKVGDVSIFTPGCYVVVRTVFPEPWNAWSQVARFAYAQGDLAVLHDDLFIPIEPGKTVVQRVDFTYGVNVLGVTLDGSGAAGPHIGGLNSHNARDCYYDVVGQNLQDGAITSWSAGLRNAFILSAENCGSAQIAPLHLADETDAQIYTSLTQTYWGIVLGRGTNPTFHTPSVNTTYSGRGFKLSGIARGRVNGLRVAGAALTGCAVLYCHDICFDDARVVRNTWLENGGLGMAFTACRNIEARTPVVYGHPTDIWVGSDCRDIIFRRRRCGTLDDPDHRSRDVD